MVQLILADKPLESPLMVLALGRLPKPAHSLPTLADKLSIDNVILTDSDELAESVMGSRTWQVTTRG